MLAVHGIGSVDDRQDWTTVLHKQQYFVNAICACALTPATIRSQHGRSR